MFSAVNEEKSTTEPTENTAAPVPFLSDELDQQPTAEGTGPEGLPAIVAESPGIPPSTIPNTFDEKWFLAVNVPKDVLKAHANAMTEEEVRDFLNNAVRTAEAHGASIVKIVRIAEPYILRERDFYNKQGQRNAEGKTWTARKVELAGTFGTSLRTFERALSKILKTTIVSYEVNIPGVVDGLEVKVLKDRLPEIKLVAERASAALASALQEERIVESPLELWQVIDLTLKNQVGNVLSVDDPREFAARLKELARAVADSFFPETVIDITPAPANDVTI